MNGKIKDTAKKAIGEIIQKTELKTPSEIKEAAVHSAHGFLSVLFGEKAFRTDIVVFAVCVAVVFLVRGLTCCERAILVYTAFIPLVAELINTAIEKTIDRISMEYHALSRLAKDIGSALVSTSFFGTGIVWVIIFVDWGLRTFMVTANNP